MILATRRLTVTTVAVLLGGGSTTCNGFTTTTTTGTFQHRHHRQKHFHAAAPPTSKAIIKIKGGKFSYGGKNHKERATATTTSLRLSPGETGTETEVTEVIIERPDPSVLLSSKSDKMQQMGFITIAASITAGTYLTIQALTVLENVLPYGWFAAWRDYTWSLPLGFIFLAAGITHFVLSDTYTAFVPPVGTWGGLWQVPAPGSKQLGLTYEAYHTYWTGLAEIGGGLLLILSGFPFHILPGTRLAAFLLFLLVAAVTPANIYMATHDVQPPRLPPIPYPEGHIFRGIMQCVLLALFWKLSFQ